LPGTQASRLQRRSRRVDVDKRSDRKPFEVSQLASQACRRDACVPGISLNLFSHPFYIDLPIPRFFQSLIGRDAEASFEKEILERVAFG